MVYVYIHVGFFANNSLVVFMDVTPEQAMAVIEGYRSRPAEYINDVYGAKLWYRQTEIVDAVFKYRDVAVASCNAVGKTFIAARIIHAFLDLIPGCIVVSTAPTARQVRDVLWREIGTTHNLAKYPLGGHLTNLGLEYDKDWFAVGLSTNEPEKFFGYHSNFILVVVDEASGVEEPIYKGVRAITPNENAHTLLIGNPTNADGTFGAAFKNPRVKTFKISAFDSPNLVANNIRNLDDLLRVFTPPEGIEPINHKPKLKLPYPSLISPTAVYDRFLEWGTESPMWQALILGEFPSQAENTLIPLNLIEAAMDSDYRKEHGWVVEDGPLEYGVDVARFGSDKTVLSARHGGFVEPLISWAKLDTSITTDRIIEHINLDDWRAVLKIDDTGVGGGVTDQLRRYMREYPGKYHYRVAPIDFGGGTANPLKFFNMRAEMYWTLRDRFYSHSIALPKDQELANELASIRYEFGGKERNIIKIESKDEIKKRLSKSPDKADALALAFAKRSYGEWGDIKTKHDSHEQKVVAPITSGLSERY